VDVWQFDAAKEQNMEEEANPTVTAEDKLKRLLSIHRQNTRNKKQAKKQEFLTQLRKLACEIRSQTFILEQQIEKLNEPLPCNLLEELQEHGAIIFLGDDELVDWDKDGLAFAPFGKEPYNEYDPTNDLIVDCHDIAIRVDFTFKACGYKLRDKDKYKAPEPLEHLEEALAKANLGFGVSHISAAISEEQWVEGLTSRAECNLEGEDINYDHHYPTKARGKGYLEDTIIVLRLRNPQ